jgi:hypothetical protein
MDSLLTDGIAFFGKIIPLLGENFLYAEEIKRNICKIFIFELFPKIKS